jgi:PKD repeat protein
MKKTILKIALILTASLSLLNCSSDNSPAAPTTPAPTVDYTYTGGGSPAPAVITFTSNTTNTSTYLWDFGDNSTSTIANPQHSYVTSGTYTVKLTASGAGGSTSVTKTINIAAALTKVKITKITLIAIPFTNLTGGGWDSSDGPDVFFKIQDVNSTTLFDATSANKRDNLILSNLPISWDFTTPFNITDLSASRFIQFYDYDSLSSNDDMGYVGFLFSNYTTGTTAYPTTVTKTQNGITVTLNLTWY